MKNKQMRIILIVLSVLVMLIMSVGCSKEEEAAATQEPTEAQATQTAEPTQEPQEKVEEDTSPPINMLDVVELTGIDANIIIKDVEEVTENEWLEVGQKFISIWVFVKNTGSEAIYIDYSPYILVDSEGTEYEASYLTPGVMYEGAYLLPGGTFEGPVYFLVANDTEAYSIKAPQDLLWETQNMAEIDLNEYSDDPGDTAFAAELTDYFDGVTLVDLNTACNYDDKLSITVTSSGFTSDDSVMPIDGYKFYQLSVSVENLSDEELDVTLDYSYLLYSVTYSNMINQVSTPFADNEMWVETLDANGTGDYVITFQAKEDSSINYLYVENFYGESEPVLIKLFE